MKDIWKWIRGNYNQIINSIAFYPAIISASFLLLSWLMLTFDFSEVGKHLKSHLNWLSLKDASTARIVVSSIVSGIISLTVFSFSMVMIVLNQAASNMSNRILDVMISNKFQQIVLGIYIGTIVYGLFLLSTIRDIQSGIYIPAMSIYLLVLLTVTDIFLFIYFLHYVTQTVKYETIIKKIYDKTITALKKQRQADPSDDVPLKNIETYELAANESGYFQGFDENQLLEFAIQNKRVVEFIHTRGSFMVKGTPMMKIHGGRLNKEDEKKLFLSIDFFRGKTIEQNPYYGFQQLVEVAVKALSPGINDGATAVSSIEAISALLAYYLHHPIASVIRDDKGNVRIITKEKSFEELFRHCLLPVWHYGKDDPFVQEAVFTAMQQLIKVDAKEQEGALMHKMMNEINGRMQKSNLNI